MCVFDSELFSSSSLEQTDLRNMQILNISQTSCEIPEMSNIVFAIREKLKKKNTCEKSKNLKSQGDI